MKRSLISLILSVIVISLFLFNSITAYAAGGQNNVVDFQQRQAHQQIVQPLHNLIPNNINQCKNANQRPPIPQITPDAQEQARQAKESMRKNGMEAPDIIKKAPVPDPDSSLSSTTYNGITIQSFDSKVSEDTLSYITEYLQQMPDTILEAFSGTIYVVSDIRNVSQSVSESAIGMFVTTGDIYIEEWDGNEESYCRTLAHELGHNFDWKLGNASGYGSFMTSADAEWIELRENYPSYRSQEGSLYSTTSIQEWFAEIVADYVCYPTYEETYYPEIYAAVDDLF